MHSNMNNDITTMRLGLTLVPAIAGEVAEAIGRGAKIAWKGMPLKKLEGEEGKFIVNFPFVVLTSQNTALDECFMNILNSAMIDEVTALFGDCHRLGIQQDEVQDFIDGQLLSKQQIKLH